jgi:L-lactate dehydrogenase complex protein LldG
MERDAFLARVRQAAEAGRAYRVHPAQGIPPDAGYYGAGDDPVERFAQEVRAVGGLPQVVGDAAAARDALSQILESSKARRALCWQHPLLERLQLHDLLESQGVERLDFTVLSPLAPEERLARMLAAEIGISSVSWAVAETGSAVLASAPGQERAASLLPPVYVTVVEAGQILPDLFDLFARLEAGTVDSVGAHDPVRRLPSNLVLITGPSKTGDIELRLTTGVHGPGVWHVIVIRG